MQENNDSTLLDQEVEFFEMPRLIRRNNSHVPWDTQKVVSAVSKAFMACGLDPTPASSVAYAVERRVRHSEQSYVGIETVQNLVEDELMTGGHFTVAKAYIAYRIERNLLRQVNEQAPEVHLGEPIDIIEADGKITKWQGADLKARIEFASIGCDIGLSKEEIERELLRSVASGIRRVDLNKLIILNAKSLMEKDSDYAIFAGRILLTNIYEEVLGWDIVKDGMGKLKEFHTKAFAPYLKRAVEIERLSEDLMTYDLAKLANELDPAADMDFEYLGIQTLYDRYLITDKTDERNPRRLETPQMFWMRVAMGIFKREEKKREAKVIELYNLYKGRRFCSSTPTLFNAGTPRSQLSSCYLYKIEDDIESIVYRGIAENALLSKWAGGLGGSWTSVRGTGARIKGTNGESQGVIPFLKMHNDQLVAINQGGKRAGSGCAYLEVWHNDIFDFLELRRNTGDDRRRTHDMNTANWIPDLFMKRVEGRQNWTLFRSSEVPDLHDLYGKAFERRYEEYEAMAERGEVWSQKIEAIDLWKRMLAMLFETGHPWVTFKDPCNVRSPQDHAGVVHSSNLCTEITLNTNEEETAVCNLGSVLVDRHITAKGGIDHAKLRKTIRTAVRALDNVIDVNFYPTEPARTSNMRHRPIGLGVMGLHYALLKKGVDFDSQAAVEFNDEVMEAIAYYAYEASSDLAAERGAYESYEGSKWSRGILPHDTVAMLAEERGEVIDVSSTTRMDWAALREKIAKQGMRNSNVLAIAPTATIANIMGTSPCIEPLYKNMYVKSNLSGDFVTLNPYMVKDLKKAGMWTPEVIDKVKYYDGDLDKIPEIPESIRARHKTAFQIPYEYLIDAAAERQKWIDQSQSLNLFLPAAEMKTMSHMYRYAWRKGLKTTYYLRTMGASGIEKSTVTMREVKEFTPEQAAQCRLDNPDSCEACQ